MAGVVERWLCRECGMVMVQNPILAMWRCSNGHAESERSLYSRLDAIKAVFDPFVTGPIDNPFDLPDPSGRDEIIMHMLGELETPVLRLTPWEEAFLASVGVQFERRGSLSDRQFATLERIYAEKTA